MLRDEPRCGLLGFRGSFRTRSWLTTSSSTHRRNFSAVSTASTTEDTNGGSCAGKTNEKIDDTTSKGDAKYQRYLATKQQILDLRSDMERNKSIQLYKAWESAESKAKDEKAGRVSRKGGVAVVKTLVRQVNEESQMQDRLSRNIRNLERQAQLFLEEAALQYHNPQALVVLGNQCLEEDGDATRAMDLWMQSGTGTGWFNVGHLLWAGFQPDLSKDSEANKEDLVGVVPADRTEAMRAFERAVEREDADAMYFVGVQTLSEDDSSSPQPELQDLKRGLKCLERASELGHGGAMYYLALLHLQGSDRLGISKSGDQEFARRLNLACDDGQHPDAWFLRGHCHFHGDHSFERSVRRALEDFLRAADAGHADAAVSAGAILFQGNAGDDEDDDDVVPRDRRRAFELYQHAGELGSTDGWRNVVACYATGQGVPQSLETAQYIAQTMLASEYDEKVEEAAAEGETT
jgi:TPR repeat protein